MFSIAKNSPPLYIYNRGTLCEILCARFEHGFSLKIARPYGMLAVCTASSHGILFLEMKLSGVAGQ